MKRSLLFAFLACSLSTAVGCTSKDAPQDAPQEPSVARADCATAVANYVDGPVQQTQLAAVAAERTKTYGTPPTAEDKQADLKLWAARAPMWKAAITKRCIEDKWSAASIECYAKTKTSDPTDCGLTPAQLNNLANMPGD